MSRAVQGEDGLGDDYFPWNGNGGYDVGHYALRLRYEPRTDRLQGSTTLWLLPKQDLASLTMDFVSFPTKVTVDGVQASFSHEDSKVRIEPKHVLRTGRTVRITVAYDTVPSQDLVDGWSAWRRTSDGALAIGEPSISAWWFPGNDHPSDKATFDVSVAVPADGSNTSVISNGTLAAVTHSRGWTYWNWRSNRPTATYLMFLAIGKYTMEFSHTSRGLPQILAWSANLGNIEAHARNSLHRSGEVIDFLSSMFGPYPFEAVGGVVPPVDSVQFALENQTRPVYSPRFFADGVNTTVIVHELAHQWFGNSVSLSRWRDIWLNEGLATYAEWLWSEKHGDETAADRFAQLYEKYSATDRFWRIPPADPGSANLFSTPVYQRGAMAVHALRTAVGNRTFFRILRTWAATHRHANGTLPEFINLAERCAGRRLDTLFTDWLTAPARPQYPTDSTSSSSDGAVSGHDTVSGPGSTMTVTPQPSMTLKEMGRVRSQRFVSPSASRTKPSRGRNTAA